MRRISGEVESLRDRVATLKAGILPLTLPEGLSQRDQARSAEDDSRPVIQ